MSKMYFFYESNRYGKHTLIYATSESFAIKIRNYGIYGVHHKSTWYSATIGMKRILGYYIQIIKPYEPR